MSEETTVTKEQEAKKVDNKKEFAEIRNLLQAAHKGIKEVSGKASNLRVSPSNNLVYPDFIIGKKSPEICKISPLAFSQLIKRFKIPEDFYKALSPDIRADIFNWFLASLPKEEKWGIDMLGKFVRGFIFGKDIRFTHELFLGVFITVLKEEIIIESSAFQDNEMIIRVILPNRVFTKGFENLGGNFAGIIASNSEFALHSPKLDLAIYRESPSSYILPRIMLGNSLKRYFRARFDKLGKDEAPASRLQIEMEDALCVKLEGAMGGVSTMAEKARKRALPVDKFPAWLEKIRIKYKFSKKFEEGVLERYKNEEPTLLGAAFAFAFVAGKITDNIKRTEMESLAGLLLETA